MLHRMGDENDPNDTAGRRGQELYYIWAFPTIHPAGIMHPLPRCQLILYAKNTYLCVFNKEMSKGVCKILVENPGDLHVNLMKMEKN